ncbi:hypothetical protein NXW84_15210 [Bacteroides fragilis]|nr:hypothetical protein NXW84_15210 [Bacteroides fragilis]
MNIGKEVIGWQFHVLKLFLVGQSIFFVHLAIVVQGLSDGEELSKLIDSEWKVKYKKAIPDDTVEANKFYDELLIVRQQLRNFVAHGAFGKDGNAFAFHSHTQELYL